MHRDTHSSNSITRFSIIIVHRNGEKVLENTLRKLHQAVGQSDEVLLVDNGSTDKSLDLARAITPGIRIIENGCNKGFAAACNQGIRASSSRYILLLNNDVQVSSETLDRLEQCFLAEPECAAASPLLVGPEGEAQRSFGFLPTIASELGLRFLHRKQPPTARQDGRMEVESVIGACMAIRRSAADQVGLLDEDFFFYFEETEWCYRFLSAGWKILLDTASSVTHLKGSSVRRIWRRANIEMFRSRILYYFKAFPRPAAYALTLYRLLRLILNLATHTLAVILTAGTAKSLRARLASYAYTCFWLLSGCRASLGLPGKCQAARDRQQRP